MQTRYIIDTYCLTFYYRVVVEMLYSYCSQGVDAMINEMNHPTFD